MMGGNDKNIEDKKRKSFIRRHPVLLIFFVLLIAFPSLNYSGMCISQMRWLSDEERFRLVIEQVINRDVIPIMSENHKTKHVKQIKYESIDDLLEQNPDCCKINPDGGSDLATPSFVDRIIGFNLGKLVGVDYKVKYLDENRKEQFALRKLRTFQKNFGNTAEYF